MELLLSNYQPAVFKCNTPKDYMEEALKICETLKIASGYISSDALIDLKRIIELNGRPRLELLIGMHYFDGFTKNQYEAARTLNAFLQINDLGFVYIANTLKFHGKMYSFTMIDATKSAVVGSSNLGSLYDKVSRQYEADILLKGEESSLIHASLEEIITKIGSPFENVPVTKFVEFNQLLENHENVSKVDKDEKAGILRNLTGVKFEIPIKSKPKSNLNPYFGKGRENQRGYIAPRPWYEVELIVSKGITSQPGYPSNQTFEVFTDDNWAFKCETNGDYSKNFRSKDDLKILGKWIKGRMEESGALKMGTPVTDNVIAAYGRNTIGLFATKDPSIWYLDFDASK
ncbi:restriction endonuclease PLD domain-containing protein [Mucilaginibacter sp. 3215]|uniref:restriction endonuclease PLD domain-containing protein n=1 Tax=Mucilaginibacter sp. 3215 TaxID=3373912 RepID=UPI003D1E0B10